MMLEPGDRIGDWVVEARLGAGGMGTVYRCRNALAERIRAAVKVLHPDDPSDFRQRFVREVEALEQLEHPAIVRVKGWGEDPRGWLWLAMDLVDGADLGQRLADGPLSIDEATAVFGNLADGLAHAHERNVFHRDIKPANILLQTSSGPAAKLVDFGIAMQGGRTRLSSAGLVPGTPAYLAPEVFGGTPHPQKLDIYALGQVLYESITGKPAFPEPNGMTTTARIAHVAGSKLRMEPLDPGPDFPDHLRQLVRRSTHPDPQARIADMETFARAVRGEVLQEPRTAPSTMELDLDAIEPEPATATPTEPEPIEPDPVGPEPVSAAPVVPRPTSSLDVPTPPRSRTPAVLALLGLFVVFAALGVVAVRLASSGRTTPTTAVVTGVDSSTPLLVRMNGTPVAPTNGLSYAVEGLQGTVTIEVVAGAHCDLDAWSGDCGLCCACATEEIQAGERTMVPLSVPNASRQVVVDARRPGSPVTAWIDDVPLTADATGTLSRRIRPGLHKVAVERGDCPSEARGCGADCPPGCASQVEEVEVSCGSEVLDIRLDVAEPVLPEAPVHTSAPTARFPSLRGASIRVIHMPAELTQAHVAADALRATGAKVELFPLAYEHSSSFGKVIWWEPEHEQGAHDIGKVLAKIGYAEFRPRSKRDHEPGLDFAVWFKAP